MKAGSLRAARELLGEEPVLVDESANFFGRRSAGRFQLRGNGCLALGDEQLVFVMWLPRRELAIQRSSITAVDTADSHLGKRVGRPLLRVAFDDDVAAWLVRDPDRWLATLG
jgi:hypothetical protein